ncbi:helix-turn-helix transcriptional regulator [Aeromonas salmonicida]|uniref:helix-turn-helix transcriptional regulator n=1 Tax=Aeromonas salmonicida TaxID=645 RepID=UPI0038BBF02E
MDSLNLNAEELRDFRRVLDWSQQRMADELGVARNTINRMEKGHMAIEIRTALAVRYLAWHHSMIEKAPTKQPGQANVQAAPELGDSHKQVALPLPSSEFFDEASTAVKEAWKIYAPVFCEHPNFAEFEYRYFKVFGSLDPDYTYLFLLQLLERLQGMAFTNSGPVSIYEMLNYKNLREFAQKLYKANPQWH